MGRPAGVLTALLVAVLGMGAVASARAASWRYCDAPVPMGVAQQDRLLRFSAQVRRTLDASGAQLALISRSGLELDHLGVGYSHAGLSLREGLALPWTVRQLYYACDEQRPRVFDQGLAGFVMGLSDASRGRLSAVLLRPEDAREVEQTLLDRARVKDLLGARYSANAYPYSTRYQNCNQWVAELLAVAWGGVEPAPGAPSLRGQAQQWLQAQGYRPTRFDVAFPPVRWLNRIVPWLHHDDHPAEALDRQQLLVSMPAALEAFVRERVPAAERIEFCHEGDRMVVHRGWQPMVAGCQPAAGDEVYPLE